MTLEERCKAQLGQLLFDVMTLQTQIEELTRKVQELEWAAQADKPTEPEISADCLYETADASASVSE